MPKKFPLGAFLGKFWKNCYKPPPQILVFYYRPLAVYCLRYRTRYSYYLSNWPNAHHDFIIILGELRSQTLKRLVKRLGIQVQLISAKHTSNELCVQTWKYIYTYLAWFSMKTKVSTLVHFIKVSISTVRIVMLKYTHCKF